MKVLVALISLVSVTSFGSPILCVAQCIKMVEQVGSSPQKAHSVQVMATGRDAQSAFSSLASKCQDTLTTSVDWSVPYHTFTLDGYATVYMDGAWIYARAAAATAESACVDLGGN